MGKSNIIDIPVSNATKHDVVLSKCLVVGRLQMVQSVTPLEVKLNDKETENQKDSLTETLEISTSTSQNSQLNQNKTYRILEVD